MSATTLADTDGQSKAGTVPSRRRRVAAAASALLALTALSEVRGDCPPNFLIQAQTFAPGTKPSSAAIGDFNGDGEADFAVANYGDSNVAVYLASGAPAPGSPPNPSFSAPVKYPVGPSPYSIVAEDFDRDGDLDLVTANFGARTVSFLRNSGDGTFAPAVNFTVGSRPRQVIAHDFNHDGNLDLATANYGSNNVSVLLGNGTGGFGPATSYALPNSLGHGMALAAGDFNGDGHLDLAVVSYTSGPPFIITVSLFLGDGSGGFGPAANFYPGGDIPTSIAAEDFNEDGNLDVVVALKTAVNVLLGTGTGSLSAPTNAAPGSNVMSVLAQDLNGDGHADLALAETGGLISYYGDGTGRFPCSQFLSRANAGLSLRIGDLNRDGSPDLLFVDGDANSVFLFLNANIPQNPQINDHCVTFKSIVVTPYSDTVATSAASVEPTDPVPACGNGSRQRSVWYRYFAPRDGTVTVDTVGSGYDTIVSVYVFSEYAGSCGGTSVACDSGGAGGGASKVSFAARGGWTYFVMVSAPNGDGGRLSFKLDFRGSFACASPSFGSAPSYATGTVGPTALAMNDFDRDGRAEVAVSSWGSATGGSELVVFRGLGTGGVTRKIETDVAGRYAFSIVSGHFWPSIFPDVVFGSFYSSSLINGRNLLGDFVADASAPPFSAPMNPRSIAVGDFNRDGRSDIAVAEWGSSEVSVFLGRDPFFDTARARYPVGTNPAGIVAADFNGDQILDLATANYGSNNVSILFGTALGFFVPGGTYAVGSTPAAIVAGDFDGGGAADDLAVANYASGNVSVLLNAGSGTFSAATSYGAGSHPTAIATGDLNGDGFADLVVTNLSSNNLTVRLGDGAGGFGAATSYATGSWPRFTAVGDVNRDGRPDLVTANYASNSITVRLNTCGGP